MSTPERIGYLLGKYGDLFLKGVGVTLLLAIAGTAIGLILGLGLALLRNLKRTPQDSRFKVVIKVIASQFARIYIEVFRGTPMMVQAIIIYFGGKMIGIPWTYLVCGLFVISINTTAYMAEIIRSGINGVDVGQTEAARSLGYDVLSFIVNSGKVPEIHIEVKSAKLFGGFIEFFISANELNKFKNDPAHKVYCLFKKVRQYNLHEVNKTDFFKNACLTPLTYRVRIRTSK